MSKKLSSNFLKKLKVPEVLIPGLIIASILGWAGWQQLKKIPDYYSIKKIFPAKTTVAKIVDGDTLIVKNGMTVRLLGIDAPAKGETNYQDAADLLTQLTFNKEVSLEYDQYQDDKYGRLLAYIWINCEENIRIYCHDDRAMVNEILNKKGLAKKVTYEKRKKLKYEDWFK